MATIVAKELLERFLRYAVIDTMSDEALAATRRPSTDNQWDLLNLLVTELKSLGLEDVCLDEKGVVIAHIPSNLDHTVPTIGLMAHVDTADDVMGNGVKPRVIEAYAGGDIKLNEEYSIVAAENTELAGYLGKTLIVTDGTTLLGSDDKAGVAEIMTVAQVLCSDKTIKHGELELIFTCDEETGAGMDDFPYDKIRCDYCYTVDGGKRFEIESECFNAATVKVHFSGVSYHLGAARGRLVNAVTMAAFFVNGLPQAESPEATDGRYGYYCAQTINGNATDLDLILYLRDFDLTVLDRRIEAIHQLAKATEALYPNGTVTVEAKHVYYNMVFAAQKKPIAMESLKEAGKRLGMKLDEQLIRGGTDGARMANEAHIPCPNIFTGGHNLHSRFEWAALPAMVDSASLVLEIVKIGAEA
ncbi:peptidase T [uncultured Sphaerochaeta sp.]|uniref:peptidase T n=1 Tax=uncultured Sphaerochaeta sp. TaxID=886478 RepID=UPI002A0A9652|nr:peptidase T [uncultured Sphaerochaeta sp.]